MDADTKQQLLEKIKLLPDNCFDGHTEFYKLSSKEKLQWLAESVYFVYNMSKQNPELGCSRFFKLHDDTE